MAETPLPAEVKTEVTKPTPPSPEGAAFQVPTEAPSITETLTRIESGQINSQEGLQTIGETGSVEDLNKMFGADSATVPKNPAERDQAHNAEQAQPTAEANASDAGKPKPLTADDIRAEARRQMRDGIITPEQAQQAIDNAEAVAQRNAGNTPEASTPIPGLENANQAEAHSQQGETTPPVLTEGEIQNLINNATALSEGEKAAWIDALRQGKTPPGLEEQVQTVAAMDIPQDEKNKRLWAIRHGQTYIPEQAHPSSETSSLSNDQLVARETALQQQLAKGEANGGISQETYRAEMAKLAEQTGVGVSQTEADTPEGSSSYTVEDATIHEPTADQRAEGAKVTENEVSLELNAEQQARFEGMKLATELTNLGIDMKSNEGLALAIEIAKNPALLETVKQTKEALTKLSEVASPEIANASAAAAKDEAEAQMKDAEAKGDHEKASKMKGLLKILLALIAVGAFAVGGAAMLAVGQLEGQTKR